ncbi:DgyrCDS10076 [Dimorphilus gyrociliatus]|uniref:DgyrCDS10076 n=1 Tax=Dimorphilus gyrociliatus TaxID=2664684 RepID=A0A7I8VZ17_9ANNE|nr:DgyrCDS10076 [Dimorphilus gyrociliatus]
MKPLRVSPVMNSESSERIVGKEINRTLLQIHSAPKNRITEELVMNVKDYLKIDKIPLWYNKESDLETEVVKQPGERYKNSIGIVFRDVNDSLPDSVVYSLRLPIDPDGKLGQKDWFTRSVTNNMPSQAPVDKSNIYGGSPNYVESGFLTFQLALDHAILKHRLPNIDEANFEVRMNRSPHPPYKDDPVVRIMQFMAFVIFMSYNVFTANFVNGVVEEKEKRLREFMRIYGLKSYLNWLSWIFKSLITLIVITILLTLFLKVKTNNGSFFPQSDVTFVFFFFFMYGLSVLSFCCITAAIFNTVRVASGLTSLITFLTYMPNFFLANQWPKLSAGAKWGTGILYNMALGNGWSIIQIHEGAGYGAKWSNINSYVTVDQNFKLSYVLALFTIQIVIHLLIVWYLDNVFPGEYGVPRPPYFPFTKNYWLGTTPKQESQENIRDLNFGDMFEHPDSSLKPSIRIRQLVKTFDANGKKTTAVDKLNMDIYEGQITALLGHNGAGKSTAMAMLTGLLKPSDGNAYIYGHSIKTDIESARQHLGYCPQDNVLFDLLTVEQHLRFFAELKGCQKENLQREIDSSLKFLDLFEKKHDLPGELSGGQKRRLCIGIGLINGSNTLILDEPTAGLDPEARRKMWDILQKIRNEKTIILATHFMDEADLLGDRIGIMANGQLQCIGSSLFLKSKFGVGYHMVMAKASNCDVDKISQTIRQYVPNALLESNISSELSYILPKESSENYEEMFRVIEDNLKSLGINSFGVSITTMEEVFLKVGEITKADGIERLQKKHDTSSEIAKDTAEITAQTTAIFQSNQISGLSYHFNQMKSQFSKKFSISTCFKLLLLFQLLFPAFLVLLPVINARNIEKSTKSDNSPKDMTLSMVNENNILFGPSIQTFEDGYKSYVTKFKGTSFETTDNPNMTAALIDIGRKEVTTYLNRYLIACKKSNDTKIAFFNAQYYHTAAISLSAYTNGLMKAFVGEKYSIKTINHPLPFLPDAQAKKDQRSTNIVSAAIISNFVISAALLFNSFSYYLIKERASGSKHLQFVSGIKILNYWIPHYIFDVLFCLLGLTFVLAAACAGRLRGLVADLNYLKAFTLSIGLAMSGMPLTYLISGFFTTPTAGITFILMFFIFLGILPNILVIVMRIIDTSASMNVAIALDWLFTTFWPSYNYGIGLTNILQKQANLKACSDIDKDIIREYCEINSEYICCKEENTNTNYFSFDKLGIGKNLLFLFFQAALYFGLVIFRESNIFINLKRKMNNRLVSIQEQLNNDHDTEMVSRVGQTLDEDVEREKNKIASLEIHNGTYDYIIVAQGLYKYYGSLLAVKDLSLGVKKGTCFGLLGVNGAGKTTTFKMLTGDEVMSKGSAYINGINVSTDLDKTHKLIGYCPQFDAIIDELTVTEMINLYCRIRGVDNAKELCNELLDILLLRDHAKKLTVNLSGGNKRKLSTALAFIGNPPIVFLDEPTSGMDPLAKRIVWDVITKMRDNGTSVVLTSHSMEECEALCTEMAIMVNGEFKCYGGVQHLKSKYGEGYSLIAKVKSSLNDEYSLSDATEELKGFVESTFEGSKLKDAHDGYVHYQISSTNARWSTLFSIMEKAKERYRIEDYSVSQTTLEEVFIGFAKLQHDKEHIDIPFKIRCGNYSCEIVHMTSPRIVPEMQSSYSVSKQNLKKNGSSAITQFRILCRKNFLLVSSSKGQLAIELLIPLCLGLLFFTLRNVIKPEVFDQPTVWSAFPAKEFTNKTNGTYLQIYSTPKNALTERLAESARNFLNISNRPKWYDKESDLEADIVKQRGDDYKNAIGIIFKEMDNGKLADEAVYSLRFPTDPDGKLGAKDWFTRGVQRQFITLSPVEKDVIYGADPSYAETGFLPLQLAINRALLRERSSQISESYFDILMNRLPHPHYTSDPIPTMMPFLAFIIFISFNVNTLNFIRGVVLEKEKRLKELMKICGLKSSLNWFAWILRSMIVLVVVSLLFTFFLCVQTKNGAFLAKSDPSLIFVFFLMYGMSVLSYCCIVSAIFSQARAAATVGSLFSFFTYMPNFFLANRWEAVSTGAKWGTGVLYNMALVHGWTLFQLHETAGYGAKWSNINSYVTVDQNFKIANVLILFTIDIVVYLFIAWYLDNVFPGPYGIPKPPYFLCSKAFWTGSPVETDNFTEEINDTQLNDMFEKPTDNLNIGIRVRKLEKSFSVRGKKTKAVNGLDMDIFEGQITALLGHNGAGKSTAMAMLTGLLKPSGGNAYINGHSIKTDIEGARQQLGYCPQDNVVFDLLTVEQHLRFFAELKGCQKENLQREIDDTINLLGLNDKRKDFAGKLSGGQKRRLCIGIALINGSNTLILDEPTAGLDPEARRKMWDILQKIRNEKTIILATHFMDEADLLGDRIGIMANGQLQCIGSSLFLKSKFGVGYHLVMAKASNCDVDKISQTIRQYVPNALLESNISSELSYILPKESSENYEEMFRDIEDNLETLGITSFGVSITTMEEVFLKVGEITNADGIERLKKTEDSKELLGENTDFTQLEANVLFQSKTLQDFNFTFEQLKSQFSKKLSVTLNNRILAFFQMIFPEILVLLAVINSENIENATKADNSERDLSLGMVDHNNVVFGSTVQAFEDGYKSYVTKFKGTSFDTTNNPNLTAVLIDIGKQEVTTFLSRYLIACEMSTNTKIAYFNAQYYHTAAISLSAYMNGLMKAFVGEKYSIKTFNHPLPFLPDAKAKKDQQSTNIASTGVVSNFIIASAIIYGTLCIYAIKERMSKSKHLQFVSGVSSLNYWIPHYIYDFLNILLALTIIIIIATAAQLKGLKSDENYLKAFVLSISFASAGVPLTYLFCNLFTVPSTGNTMVLMMYLFSGTATVLSVLVMRIIGTTGALQVSEILDWIFTFIWPFYNFGIGLANIFEKQANLKTCGNIDESTLQSYCKTNDNFLCCKSENRDSNYFSFDNGGIGKHILFLFLQGAVFFGIVVLKESNMFVHLKRKMHKKLVEAHEQINDDSSPEKISSSRPAVNEDVDRQKEKILSWEINDQTSEYVLVAKTLYKYYGSLLAVKDLSLGVKKGTCFGLLGVNGAGKTTTFKMLTGDEVMSKGSAYINGINVSTDLDKTHKLIGYCPQFDAIIDELTVTEMINLYCRIRGVDNAKELCNELLDILLLRDHAKKLTVNLSGGNKRKLSTALAFIGNPPIVFLDEPTSGMDPLAKRIVWDVITKMRDNGTSVVLTSHSMEECEALCTEMAIMVNGEFKCYGGVQHLKSKYGEGYSLIAKVKSSLNDEYSLSDATEELKGFVESTFEGSKLKDAHDGYVHYQISSTNARWSTLFSIMEKAKERYRIEDYSVSQTTLEEVFIGFAKLQKERECRNIPPSIQCRNCMKFLFCCGCCN